MDQKKRPAARGYGYVAVSRFMHRRNCYLYGKLRRSDFLPVGAEREDEVLARGLESEDSDSEARDECAWGMRSDAESMSDTLPEMSMGDGNELNEFV